VTAENVMPMCLRLVVYDCHLHVYFLFFLAWSSFNDFTICQTKVFCLLVPPC